MQKNQALFFCLIDIFNVADCETGRVKNVGAIVNRPQYTANVGFKIAGD